jgi:hypoxanthine phosphoribosyltransferase
MPKGIFTLGVLNNMDSAYPLEILVNKKTIAEAVKRLAAEICQDYGDKNPILVGILKGSYIFMADLSRCLNIPLAVDFVRVSSYGSGTESSGKIKLVHDIASSVQDRHIIIVEDLVDTGFTTAFSTNHLKQKNPASVKLCALADKPSRRKTDVHIDYLGFTLPDKFIVGYGTDWNEKYRNLPDICYIPEK